MYNLYVLEKKEKQEQLKKHQEKREMLRKEKRKKLLPQLYERYESRVKEFIIEMAQPKKPKIIVKDHLLPVESTRKVFLDENDKYIQGKRGFTFKGYKSEKERVEESIKNSHFLFSSKSEKVKPLNNSPTASPGKISNNHLREKAYDECLVQPEMRFKPRTDLERVFDAINQNNFGRANIKVLYRQLKELDLNVSKKRGNGDDISDLMEEEELGSQPVGMKEGGVSMVKNAVMKTLKMSNPTSSLEQTQKKYQSLKRLKGKSINAEAKNLMSDLYEKTHFKGAAVIATQQPVLGKKILPGILGQSTGRPKESDLEENANVNGITSLLRAKSMEKLISPESTYKKNYNPHLRSPSEDIDINNFRVLSQIAFADTPPTNSLNKTRTSLKSPETKKKNCTRNRSRFSVNDIEEPYKRDDDNKITIGKESFNRNQMNVIANKVLNFCNVYHSKNKNSNTCLRIGEGKLMMTNGMSISDFENKYHLKQTK